MQEVEIVIDFQNSMISQDGVCSIGLEVVSQNLNCLIELVPLSSPGTSMQALRIHEPADSSSCFLDKMVSQSTNIPGATNKITVELRPHVSLSSEHTLTRSAAAEQQQLVLMEMVYSKERDLLMALNVVDLI
jgi:hypothetical protein